MHKSVHIIIAWFGTVTSCGHEQKLKIVWVGIYKVSFQSDLL